MIPAYIWLFLNDLSSSRIKNPTPFPPAIISAVVTKINAMAKLMRSPVTIEGEAAGKITLLSSRHGPKPVVRAEGNSARKAQSVNDVSNASASRR